MIEKGKKVMNKIFFDVHLEERSGGIAIRISIDNEWLDSLNEWHIKMEGLKNTILQSGLNILSVYDCECDTPEHNEYIYVEVEHNDKIEWKNFYSFYNYIDERSISKEELEKRVIKITDTTLVFEKNQYYEAIKKVESLYSLFEKKRNFIFSEQQIAHSTENIKEILRLSKSPYISVLRCLALNRNTPDETLKHIYQRTLDPWVAEEIVVHPNCSLALFQKILNELGDQISIADYEAEKLSNEKRKMFKKQKFLWLKSKWWYIGDLSKEQKDA